MGTRRAPGDSRDRGRPGRGEPRPRAARVRRVSRDPARPRRRDGAACPRGRRGRRGKRAHAAPPRARRGRGQPAGDGGGGAARCHRERPPPYAPGARAGVARDAAPPMPPDLAPRRPTLRAARVLGGRAHRARTEGRDHDAQGPRPSDLRQAHRGDGVTTRAADVIVVGAGPGGAATAILLAEHGLTVQLLDRARFPRPKICGEYLSPEAPRVLDRLGVLKTVDGLATPLAGMRIIAPDGTVVSGEYRAVGDWRPYREQTRVSDVLVERGQAVGVEALDRDGRVARLSATLVIAADGRTSVVAQRLGLRRAHRLKRMALVTYVSGLEGCRDYGEVFVDP